MQKVRELDVVEVTASTGDDEVPVLAPYTLTVLGFTGRVSLRDLEVRPRF
jgi:hypothetical protein